MDILPAEFNVFTFTAILVHIILELKHQLPGTDFERSSMLDDHTHSP